MVSYATTARRRMRRAGKGRRATELHLLRYVPGDSFVHRMWAGTKLIAVTAFGAVLSFKASWGAEAVLGACLAVTVGVARIPRGVAPRLPRWLWLALALGAGAALLSGGSPTVHVGGLSIGLGSLEQWARFVVLTVLLLLAAGLVGWTTPLADLAPALSRLLGPLRRLRLPVEELVVAVSLSVRCLPLLVDELRVLYAARRVRRPSAPKSAREVVEEGVDLLVCALVAATRRAREMGDAIEARGGFGAVGAPTRGLGWRDALALAVVAAVVAGMILA